MKRKTKKNFLTILKNCFLFFGVFLLLTGCEKEETALETHNEQHTHRFVPKAMNIDEAYKSEHFTKLSSNFKLDRLLNKQITGRDNENFSLDLDNFYEISYDDYISYTFLIIRDSVTDGVVENLVVEQKDGVVGGYIIKYENVDYYGESTNLYLTANVAKTNYEDDINALLDENDISFSRDVSTNGWECSTVVTVTPRECSVHGTFNSGNPACGNYGESDWDYSYNEVCEYTGSGESPDTTIDQGDSNEGNGGTTGDGATTPIIPCGTDEDFELVGSNTECFITADMFEDQIDDTNLKPCLKTILNDLKGVSSGVGHIVTTFSGNTPGFNWEVKDATLTGGTGQTKVVYDRRNKKATTTFDSQSWLDASDLSWARTILHEGIHAYIVASFGVDYTQAQLDFADFWYDYQNAVYPNSNVTHHAEIVRNYVLDIAASLQEYGTNKGYTLTRQFYEDLAWGGLTHWRKRDAAGNVVLDSSGNAVFEETDWFKTAFPSSTDRDRVMNVINIELTKKDINGNTSVQKGSNPGC